MKKIIPLLGLLLIVAMTFVIPIALAEVNFDQPLTAQETQQFDQILNPLMKIYNFTAKDMMALVGLSWRLGESNTFQRMNLNVKKYGDFGSGYLSDPKTKGFLKQNYAKHPEIFRHSWSSYQQYSDGKKSKKQN